MPEACCMTMPLDNAAVDEDQSRYGLRGSGHLNMSYLDECVRHT
jgi:hypothetical protein